MQTPLITARVLAGGRAVADPQLSPNGSYVAFVASTPYGQLIIVPSTGGQERWLPCDPAVVTVPESGGAVFGWLPDSEGMVYIGVDRRLHHLDITTSTCRSITHAPENLSGVAVSPKGNEVAYVVDTKYVLVTSMSLGSPWSRCISSDGDFVLDPAWSPNGTWLAWHQWNSPNMPWDGSRIMMKKADGSGQPTIIDGDENVSVAQPRFSPNGRFLSYLSDRNGWMNLWMVDIEASEDDPPGRGYPLIKEEAECGIPAWSSGQRTYCWTADSKHLVYSRNEKGWGRLAVVSIADSKRRDVAAHTYTSLTSNSGRAVGLAESATVAASIRTVDLSGSITELVRGPLDGVENAGYEPETVEWKSDDGTVVPGRLYRAPHPTPEVPSLLVWIHSGPTGQSPVTLNPRFSYFLQRGWSVLVPDYRGSSGWGRSFREAINGLWGDVDVVDIAAGIREAVQQRWGDANRIAVYGSSAGGFAALLTLARHPELCAAGVAVAPVSNLLDFETPPWPYQARYLETLLGNPSDCYQHWVQRSPLQQAASIKKPVLLLHGDQDIIVPVQHSIAMADSIRATGGTVEHHIYEDEGHTWTNQETLADELERVYSFLQRNVLRIRQLQ